MTVHGLRRRCLLALLVLMTAPASAKQLWLIGGGEPVCSSVEPQFCLPGKRVEAEARFTQDQALRARQFRYTEAAQRRLVAFKAWIGGPQRQQALLAGLRRLRPHLQGKTLDEHDWHAALAPLVLGEEELGLVDDIFQVRALRSDGRTQRQQVFLEGSAPYVQAIFRNFVAAAAANPQRRNKSERPRVVFLTASSTNPFEDVDYYQSLFQAAGAQAIWLPLEPALLRAADCGQLEALRWRWNGVVARAANHPEWAEYQRDLCAHPERMLQLVNSADAFFINGGDQSLTMRSLQAQDGKFTPLAQRLLDRVNGGIPLAGSSAGTAVQSGNRAGRIPMISGGESVHALHHGALPVEANAQLCELSQSCTMHGDADQLTYRAAGGLRTFSLGVVDTHFHERAREGRLLRLLLDTGTQLGFGVDEATVLIADFSGEDSATLRVVGRGGVWVVDTAGATVSTRDGRWVVSGFHASRLLAGDSARVQGGKLSIALACREANPSGNSAAIEELKTTSGGQWSVLPATGLVPACERSDGRWHYDRMPLRLTVDEPAG